MSGKKVLVTAGPTLEAIDPVRYITNHSYEDWLEELEKRKDDKYLKEINRCHSKTFFLIRENDNKLIGMINIRYQLTQEDLLKG